ncbi:MAG: hypothetical protein ACRBHB_07500 [Arenicella sp.]
MQGLIDQVLESILHSVIWRSTWHLPLPTLLLIGVIVFLILAYRRSSRSNRRNPRPSKRYRSRFWQKK